ncbi:MAG TPA: gamma-glutamyltransferase [Pseudolabrys sp.]|nr:gamma-glutamyltransferase [Pseudolabrys sp.]
MASTSHPSATLVAIEVLRQGGNAVDAAVAAMALLSVIEPTQTGIGGDCFALLMRGGEGEVIALNGSGWAPEAATTAFYENRGIKTIETESAHAVSIPGAVASWARLVADHGTMDLARLLAPAIEAADAGYPVTERVARDWAKQVGKLQRNTAAAQTFLFNGAAPQPGVVHQQPALANALRSIASGGPEEFYEGWIARDMVETLRALGGLHTLDDFADYAPEYVKPISASYRGFRLYECPPNGQGVTPLLMAKILEGFDPSCWRHDSVERYHVMAETARQAYADRDCHVGDPRAGGPSGETQIAEERASQMRARIELHSRIKNLAPVPLTEHRDTAFLAVVDKDLNTVALINSIFDDFGCGIVSPGCGVIFHNRAGGFVLAPEHPNAIAPRKRPLNTIIPAMLTRNGKAVMPFGVTGGHYQPFGQIQIMTNILDYGMGIQESIDQPRIFARGDQFNVEGAVPKATVDALRDLGHNVTRAENPLGTAQAIWIDWERGLLRGGADGRRDGIALGLG